MKHIFKKLLYLTFFIAHRNRAHFKMIRFSAQKTAFYMNEVKVKHNSYSIDIVLINAGTGEGHLQLEYSVNSCFHMK